MNYTEETTFFTCMGDTLLGILAVPVAPTATGVVVLVGGPQYRVGSHRQFVLLSRALAENGYAVLRFDYRGMGDSEGKRRDFETVSADTAAAIDQLQQRIPAIKNVVLWGLCDGASAALLYCHETHDPRISGLFLLNPWVRSAASLARTQVKHYYTRRLLQKAFWTKLARGGIAIDAWTELMQSVHTALTGARDLDKANIEPAALPQPPFQERMATTWNTFSGSIFLLLSGDDYTAKEFLEYASQDSTWKNAMTHPQTVRHVLPGADHTFSSKVYRTHVEDLTLKYLQSNHDQKT